MGKKSIKPKKVDPDHSTYLAKIGSKLKTIRETKGISVYKMSKDTGLSRNSITMIESAKIYFTSSTLLQILKYLDIDPDTFFKQL